MDPSQTRSRQGKNIGWTLLITLVIAVSIAISLAVQLDTHPGRSSPRVTPPECGGLFDETTNCCDEREHDEGSDDRGRGLFDAEEDFADRRTSMRC